MRLRIRHCWSWRVCGWEGEGGCGVRVGGRDQERMWKTWEVGEVKKVWSEGMKGDEGLVFKFLPVTSLQNNVNR